MADRGKIAYSVGLENSKLRSDAAESKRILQGIGTTAIEEGQKMDDAFKKVGTAIAGAMSVAAAVSFAKQIVNVRAEVQSLEISFRTLLGSASKADAMLGQIRQFAVQTPMLLKDLASGAQTMLGFGIAAEEVMPMLKAIGDVSMGDSQKFQSLTLAFSQATAAGKLMGGDLLQLINAGFNPLAVIAEKTGKSIGELKEEMSKGAITADMLKQAFIDATSEGGMFFGMLQSQSKGINGAISNLYGAIDDMFDAIGRKMEEPFVKGVELATELVQHYEEIGKVLVSIIAAYGAYKAALIAVIAYQKGLAIWGSVQAFLSLAKSIRTAKDAIILLNIATKANPIGLVLGVIAAAASAFALFGDSTDEATEALKRQQDEINDFNKKVSASAGKAQSEYRKLQKEYNDCKNAHEKREWIRKSQQKFKELGISVNNVNDAENIFVRNTKLMLEAFKKRAEAAAWQSKVDDEYAKRVERQLQLEQKRDAIKAGSEVKGTSHDTRGGDEYVDNSGRWVYTEQGAKKARQRVDNEIANDPILNSIDKRIDEYAKKVASVSSEMEKLFKQAGTTQLTDEEKEDAEKAKKEQDKLADEQAKRNQKIQENAEEEKRLYENTELDKRQAKISAMQAGFDKELLQNELNYDRMMAETKRREEEMLKNLEETKMLEWKNKNPKASDKEEIEYRQSLQLSVKDLTGEQRAQLQAFSKVAAQVLEKSNQRTLDKMLEDVMTYEQKRAKVAEDYAKKREQLEYTHDVNGKRKGQREGVSEANIAILEEQKEAALAAVDEEFASKEESYKAWMESISALSLEQLRTVLAQAEKELEQLKKDGKGGNKLAEAQAKVTQAKKAVAKASEKNKNLAPDKRSLKDWKELHDVLQEGVKGFEELGDAIGGTAGELMKSAGEIASGTLSMINGIMTLTQSSATAMEGTAAAGAAAMSTVEKASVILAVVSAALQVATAIANLFNNDDDKQKEIEHLQERIDQLQWELDNADVVRLRDNTISGLKLVQQTVAETRQELIKESLAVGDVMQVFKRLFTSVGKDQELLQQSAQKIADTYANVAYTANKALGKEKYDQARKDLENIAQQQILLQEQIRNEEDKKKTDHGAIQEWQNKIEELGNQAVEIINTLVEDIIGGTSTDIANELSDAFFEAFQNGEDAAEAWGTKVKEIVADVLKRMLVQKFLEEPLGEIFNKYKDRWFSNGQFNGLDAVINSMQGFANDLNSVGEDFAAIWDSLPDSVKNMFEVTADAEERQASEKGIANASQESVDELNGRATAIQGHTYTISENSKLLVRNTNEILASVMNIDRNTERMDARMGRMETDVRDLKDTMNDIALKGIKMK